MNFGLPAPIDVQVIGLDIEANRVYARRLLDQLRQVPGLVDLHIHQLFDQPKLHINVDRTKAAESGFTERDVANSMVVALSGSFQTTPSFWLNWKNGVNYSLIAQAPQYSISSLGDLENIPITGSTAAQPEILGDVASHRARRGNGGGVALQHPAHHRHFRRGAGSRPGRGGRRISTGLWTQSRKPRSRAGRRW